MRLHVEHGIPPTTTTCILHSYPPLGISFISLGERCFANGQTASFSDLPFARLRCAGECVCSVIRRRLRISDAKSSRPYGTRSWTPGGQRGQQRGHVGCDHGFYKVDEISGRAFSPFATRKVRMVWCPFPPQLRPGSSLTYDPGVQARGLRLRTPRVQHF